MSRNSEVHFFSSEIKTWSLRREFWIHQSYLKDSQLSQETTQNFAADWEKIQGSGDCFLVDESLSKEVLSRFNNLPSEVELLQSCDSILKLKGRWWPHNFWAIALRECLVARAPKLDTHKVAYLTGQDGHALASLVVMAQLGFKKIAWVVENIDEVCEQHRQIFMRHFFGINVEIILGHDLTSQANNGAILINTLSHESGVEFLQDLIFLNFLQKGGVVVETKLDAIESQLVTEAESVGMHSVPAWLLEGTRDHLLLESVVPGLVPDVELYLKEWLNFLKTRPTLSQK